MAGQRIGEWYLWQPERRARMVNKLSRRVIEDPRLADWYWRAREQRALLSTKLSKRALADPRFAHWYWDRRDRQARRRSGGAARGVDRGIEKAGRIPVVQWIDLRTEPKVTAKESKRRAASK